MQDKGSGNPIELAAVLTEYDRGFVDGVAERQKVRTGDLQARIEALEARNRALKAQLMFTCVVLGLYILVPFVLWVLR